MRRITRGVVGVVGRPHLDHRVVVDEVGRAARVPIMKAATILPRLISLRAPVIDAALDQVDHDVGEHLGVDAQVALVAQRSAHRGRGWRRCPSAASRRPARARRRARRCAARRRRSAAWPLRTGGTSTSTREVDLVDVDEAVAERARHGAVELRDHRRAPRGPPPARRPPRCPASRSHARPAARR